MDNDWETNADTDMYFNEVCDDKATIRKRIKTVRNAMHRDDCIYRSKLICERLACLEDYRNAQNICAYISKGNEVDTRLIIDKAWEDGKHVFVPKVYGKDMHFIELTNYDELRIGNFGILEPESDDHTEISSGLMFMPGVAFDRQRNRIGFGGGFYDRYLASHGQLVTVALAYDCQIVDFIDSEQTDIKPHIIVTESGVIS